jgi:multidrug efflux pump subunit AcrA (membrane-fusion protein)
VEPQFSANLSFRLLGKVVARDVDVGDRVARGVTIAALDPTALDLAVQAARAELESALEAITEAREGISSVISKFKV